MDDSNSQMFASRYFSFAAYQNHSYFASLQALIASPAYDIITANVSGWTQTKDSSSDDT